MSVKESIKASTQGSGRALIVTGVAVTIMIVGAGYAILKSRSGGPEAQSTMVGGADTGKDATGVGGSPEYNRLMAERNRQVAEQAKQQGSSAIATPLDASNCEMAALDDREKLKELERSLKAQKEENDRLQRQLADLNNRLMDAQRMQARTQSQNAGQQQQQGIPMDFYRDALGQEYISQQAYQAQRQKVKSEMDALRNNMANAPMPGFVAVSAGAQQGGAAPSVNTGCAKPPCPTAPSTSGEKTSKPAVAKPGDVLYAVLDTAINSDIPGPVLATVQSGPLKGTRLLGTFKQAEDYVVVEFNQGTLPDGRVIATKAVAVDSQTTLTGVADDVDHHYLTKFGAIAGAAFLQGYGRAVQMSSQRIEYVTTPGSPYPVPIQTNQMTGTQIAKSALADVGAALSQVLVKSAQRPPTVQKYVGSDVGILILEPATPKE